MKTRCSECNKRTHTGNTIGYFDYCDTCYHNFQAKRDERAIQLTQQQLVQPDNYDYHK